MSSEGGRKAGGAQRVRPASSRQGMPRADRRGREAAPGRRHRRGSLRLRPAGRSDSLPRRAGPRPPRVGGLRPAARGWRRVRSGGACSRRKWCWHRSLVASGLREVARTPLWAPGLCPAQERSFCSRRLGGRRPAGCGVHGEQRRTGWEWQRGCPVGNGTVGGVAGRAGGLSNAGHDRLERQHRGRCGRYLREEVAVKYTLATCPICGPTSVVAPSERRRSRFVRARARAGRGRHRGDRLPLLVLYSCLIFERAVRGVVSGDPESRAMRRQGIPDVSAGSRGDGGFTGRCAVLSLC